MSIRNRITQFLWTLVANIKCSKGNILLGRVTGAGPAQEITIGSGLTLTGTTLSVTGGGGGSVAWEYITGTPNTLGGYNITDAATSAQGAKADSAIQPTGTVSIVVTSGHAANPAISGINTLTGSGISAQATGGTALIASSTNGLGAAISSINGKGGSIGTVNGTYHVTFGVTAFGDCAIERVRGWFVWFYNAFTGRLKTADITANRDWVLPNASGTLALVNNESGLINSSEIADATPAAVANMICKRSPYGALSLAGTDGPALDAYSSGTSAIKGQSSNSAAIHGTATDAGAGLFGQSDSGYGSNSYSYSGTGSKSYTSVGTYHAHFGDEIGNDRSAIERVRGWFVWFYNGFIGRLKTDNITASRDWTLPDKAGVVGILTSYADSTAANAAVSVGDAWWDSTLKKVRVRLS